MPPIHASGQIAISRFSGRSRRRHWVAACFAAVLALACGNTSGTTSGCFGLKTGDRVELTVIEPYDANSHYTYSSQVDSSCENGLDLAAGQTLEATVSELRGETVCATGVATFGDVGGWTWQLQGNQVPRTGLLLYGLYAASMGSCSGSVEIQVSSDATPFDAPVVGQYPHVLLERSFLSDASADGGDTGCPNVGTVSGGTRSCTGTFVVSARKL